MITVYSYAACGTCKKALKWLKHHSIEFEVVPIVERPPHHELLATILRETGLPFGKLFNTSGQLYREGGYKDRLATMPEAEALRELSSKGKLIKRPLVVGQAADGRPVHLVGFREEAYQAAFS